MTLYLSSDTLAVTSPAYHVLSTAAFVIVLVFLVVALTGREMIGGSVPPRYARLARLFDVVTLPLLVAFCALVGLHVAVDILGWSL